MNIRCPNDDTHTQFLATAHVTEEWLVDAHGEFIELTESWGDIIHAPDSGDLFQCAYCMAEAVVDD